MVMKVVNSNKEISEENKKSRSSNFELLRIICMILILAYHYCIHGNDHSIFNTAFSLNQVIAIIFGSWGLLGVDCFIFISAYFLIGSQRFRTKKVVMLLLQCSFYSTALAIIMLLFHKTELSRQDILESVFSPAYNLYWFVTAYCLLYTIYPFLNKIISSIPIRTLARFLIVLTLFIPVYHVFIADAPIDAFLFFIYLYLLMGYLKQTPGNWFEVHAGKGFLFTTLFIIFYGIACSAAGTFLHLETLQEHAFRFATRYSPLMVLDAVFLFYLFQKLNIGVSKIINTLASATLGIYLFHEYPYARSLLWDGILRVKEVYHTKAFILYLLLSVISLYILGTIIDLLRKHLLEKPLFRLKFDTGEKLCSKLDAWINGV
jgi:Uncharacterized protein conserved in bacteria